MDMDGVRSACTYMYHQLVHTYPGFAFMVSRALYPLVYVWVALPMALALFLGGASFTCICMVL
jgi:hypothetical protein